jgi:hypothetical protein
MESLEHVVHNELWFVPAIVPSPVHHYKSTRADPPRRLDDRPPHWMFYFIILLLFLTFHNMIYQETKYSHAERWFQWYCCICPDPNSDARRAIPVHMNILVNVLVLDFVIMIFIDLCLPVWSNECIAVFLLLRSEFI